MAQPTPYSRSFSFTDDEAAAPAAHVPGTHLDGEFDGVAETLADVLASLAQVQRDDGALKNQVVTLDSLAPDVFLMLGQGVFRIRGLWSGLGIDYATGDIVKSFGEGGEMNAAFVALEDHKSTVNWAANEAHWLNLFDPSGVTPADGSVTAAKLADGSVTSSKIGFTALDLAGSIRGQGGIAAGTAPAGALMHAKKATGDVLVKSERTTDDQGVVGIQFIGASKTWTLEQALNNTDLALRVGTTVTATFYEVGGVDVPGIVRAVSASAPTNAGVGLHYGANIGYVTSFDYDANVWKDLKLRGKDVYLTAQGVDIAKVTTTGVDILAGKVLTIDGDPVGFLGIPQNLQDGAYTLAIGDVGKEIYSENAAGQTIVVPPDVFDGDDVITILNKGTNAIALNQGAGVTIRLAGTATTGNRTISAGGWATLKCAEANYFFVAGPGVS